MSSPSSRAPSDEDVVSVRLRHDPTPTGGFVFGFGSSFFGGADVAGDGVRDVVVAHTGRSTSASGQDGKAIFVFDGQAIAMAQGGDLRATPAGATQVGRAWPGASGAGAVRALGRRGPNDDLAQGNGSGARNAS